MAQKPTFSSVYKTKGFKVLLINQVLMQLAINTLNFSLILWVFKLTDSNFAVSGLLLAIYLPAFLFGLYAGVLVDRIDRKRLIILVDILLAGAFFLFPFIRHSYPLILLNTFLINTLTQFFIPAEGSAIPLLVKRAQLFVANSLFTFTLYACFMVGFSIAGPILNNFSISPIFNLGGALLIVAALFSQSLPKLKTHVASDGFKIWEVVGAETRATFAFIKGKLPVATSIGLLATVQGVIGVLAVLVPSYMERVLKVHATDASLFLMLPLGLGMISGAFIVGQFFHSVPRRKIVIPAVMAAGILLFGVGIAPDVARALDTTSLPEKIRHLRYFLNAPSLASTFATGAYLLGVATVSIIIPTQTVLQENTTDYNRGKILAVLAVLMNAFAAVPVILAGGLADLIGVTPIFLGLGVIIFLIGILASKPNVFGDSLPFNVREFLGLGHWKDGDVSKSS